VKRFISRFIAFEIAQLIFVCGAIFGMLAEAAIFVAIMGGHNLLTVLR
jgi:hypothetical protein